MNTFAATELFMKVINWQSIEYLFEAVAEGLNFSRELSINDNNMGKCECCKRWLLPLTIIAKTGNIDLFRESLKLISELNLKYDEAFDNLVNQKYLVTIEMQQIIVSFNFKIRSNILEPIIKNDCFLIQILRYSRH